VLTVIHSLVINHGCNKVMFLYSLDDWHKRRLVALCLGTISIKKIASVEVDAAEHPLPPKFPTPISSVTWLLRRRRKSVFVTASFYTKLRISVINGDIKGYLG